MSGPGMNRQTFKVIFKHSKYGRSMPLLTQLAVTFAIIQLFAGIMLILSAGKLNSTDSKKIRKWSYTAIVMALISNLGALLNFGFIIAAIGAIIGVWHSKGTPGKKPTLARALILIGGAIVICIAAVPLLFAFGVFSP